MLKDAQFYQPFWPFDSEYLENSKSQRHVSIGATSARRRLSKNVSHGGGGSSPSGSAPPVWRVCVLLTRLLRLDLLTKRQRRWYYSRMWWLRTMAIRSSKDARVLSSYTYIHRLRTLVFWNSLNFLLVSCRDLERPWMAWIDMQDRKTYVDFYTVSQKNMPLVLGITLTNVDRFSEFFHSGTLQ